MYKYQSLGALAASIVTNKCETHTKLPNSVYEGSALMTCWSLCIFFKIFAFKSLEIITETLVYRSLNPYN